MISNNFKTKLVLFGVITLSSSLINTRLPLLTLPITLLAWFWWDRKMHTCYVGFKSGEARNYQKLTQAEAEAFLIGVKSSKSYLNQFSATLPGNRAWRSSKSYYAGLFAAQLEDNELISMVRSKVS